MSGKIRIGTLIGVGKTWLVPEMLNYAQENEELEVIVKLGFKESLIEMFCDNQLDFLVLPETEVPSEGEKLFLTDEKIALVYPKGNPFNIHRNMNLDELLKIPTVLFEENDPLYIRWCQGHFHKTVRPSRSRFIVNGHGNMLQAVSAGLGIAILPKHVVERSAYRFQVETCDDDMLLSNGKLFLVYHSGAERIVRIQKTIERLMSDYKSALL